MENQHGPWECPENIPIGANLDQLPQAAKMIEYKKLELNNSDVGYRH
jgi:hypothetical protein